MSVSLTRAIKSFNQLFSKDTTHVCNILFVVLTAYRRVRHRIVMCASAMPDPREISYDLLLS